MVVDQLSDGFVLLEIGLVPGPVVQDVGDLGQTPGVQGVQTVEVDGIEHERSRSRTHRHIIPVREVVLAGFPLGPDFGRSGLRGNELPVRSPFQQSVPVAVAARLPPRSRLEPKGVPFFEVRIGEFQELPVARFAEQLEKAKGSDGRLGPVGGSAESAPPLGHVSVGVLGLEGRPDGVGGVTAAFEREFQGVEQGIPGGNPPGI